MEDTCRSWKGFGAWRGTGVVHIMTVMRPLHWIFVALSVGACGGAVDAGWQGEIRELENGARLISNPEDGLWTPRTAWRLQEDLRLGSIEGDDPASFAEVVDVAVDGWGRIYVMDRQYLEIRVFEPDGSYVRTIGREGGGPGEFRRVQGMSFDAQDRLWVVDIRNPLYAVFDTTGEFLESYRRETTRWGYLWPGGWTRDEGLWDYSGAPRGDDRVGVLVRYDTSISAFADTLFLPEHVPEFYELTFEQGRMSFLVPYTPRLHYRLDAQGWVWAGVSDRYRVHSIGFGGDTLGAFERAYAPVPVTTADREAFIAEYDLPEGAKVDWSRIPDHKPAFDRIDVDDRGNVWIRQPKGYGAQTTVFDVFDDFGRFLGSLSLPLNVSSFMPVWVVAGNLYAVHTDELDVPYVVRLRIVDRAR